MFTASTLRFWSLFIALLTDKRSPKKYRSFNLYRRYYNKYKNIENMSIFYANYSYILQKQTFLLFCFYNIYGIIKI